MRFNKARLCRDALHVFERRIEPFHMSHLQDTIVALREINQFRRFRRSFRHRLFNQHGGSRREERQRAEDQKRVYYLSLEFLIGRLLKDMLHNIGMTEVVGEGAGGAVHGDIVTIDPDVTLAANTTYRVIVGAEPGIRDKAGNPLEGRSWTIKTGTRFRY